MYYKLNVMAVNDNIMVPMCNNCDINCVLGFIYQFCEMLQNFPVKLKQTSSGM